MKTEQRITAFLSAVWLIVLFSQVWSGVGQVLPADVWTANDAVGVTIGIIATAFVGGLFINSFFNQ